MVRTSRLAARLLASADTKHLEKGLYSTYVGIDNTFFFIGRSYYFSPGRNCRTVAPSDVRTRFGSCGTSTGYIYLILYTRNFQFSKRGIAISTFMEGNSRQIIYLVVYSTTPLQKFPVSWTRRHIESTGIDQKSAIC